MPSTSIIIVAVSAIVLCVLAGCGGPQLQGTWPINDRVVVVESGIRKDLVRVEIFWPGFPAGAPVQYLSETQPRSDSTSLRRFHDESPAWRRLQTLRHYVVEPIRYYVQTQPNPRADIILSIHPVVIGVVDNPVPNVEGRHPDLLVRPEDLSWSTRIVRLVHAQRFPDQDAIDRAIARQGSSAWSDHLKLMIDAIEPRIVDLERPLSIDEAMRFIEEQEAFRHIKQ